MLEFTDHQLRGHIMKSADAMEHMTLKDNCVSHRMFLVWTSVTNNMFGKSSNEKYQNR